MLRSKSKYDHMKARSEWLNHSPNGDSTSFGKKRFPVHKNKNSSQFQQVIYPSTSPIRRSLPSIVESTKKIRIKELTKEVEVQVETDQISRLEQQLKDKETQLSIMQNIFNHSTNRVKENNSRIDYEIFRRQKTDSNVEENTPVASGNRESSLVIRNSSLPTIRSSKFIDYAHHPAFIQPKFTRSRPKIILTNPITGVIPYY